MKRVNMRGFTLIEVMVVVVIIAILAGIGFPIYTQQVERARRADGPPTALLVALAQESFFARNSTYTIDLTDSELRLHSEIGKGLSESGHYNVAIAPGAEGIATSFVITITPVTGGAQAGDDECQKMTLDQVGVKRAWDKSDTDSTAICW